MYTAWSVVDFEQPTAAKWNQLGENDAWFDSLINKDGSNKMGINNASPLYGLDMITQDGILKLTNVTTDSTDKQVNMVIEAYDTDEEEYEMIRMYNVVDDAIVYVGGGNTSFNAATKILFFTGAINTLTGTERMRIQSSGNVGIGNSDPQARLHVAGDANTEVLVSGTDTAILRLLDEGGPADLKHIGIVNDAGVMIFRQYNDSIGVKRDALLIGAEGNLQIPELTATPTAPSDASRVNIYMKSDTIIFQYNDGGTVRYKSLLLSGTGSNWNHTTVAP